MIPGPRVGYVLGKTQLKYLILYHQSTAMAIYSILDRMHALHTAMEASFLAASSRAPPDSTASDSTSDRGQQGQSDNKRLQKAGSVVNENDGYIEGLPMLCDAPPTETPTAPTKASPTGSDSTQRVRQHPEASDNTRRNLKKKTAHSKNISTDSVRLSFK